MLKQTSSLDAVEKRVRNPILSHRIDIFSVYMIEFHIDVHYTYNALPRALRTFTRRIELSVPKGKRVVRARPYAGNVPLIRTVGVVSERERRQLMTTLARNQPKCVC